MIGDGYVEWFRSPLIYGIGGDIAIALSELLCDKKKQSKSTIMLRIILM